MALLRRKKATARKEPQGDPLKAVPRVAVGVQAQRDDGGNLHIRKEYPQTGSLSGWMGNLLRLRKERFVNLDEKGAAFWNLIDGNRDLKSIAKVLASEWDLDETECRCAVVVYTRDLMVRNLIELKVKQPGGKQGCK